MLNCSIWPICKTYTIEFNNYFELRYLQVHRITLLSLSSRYLTAPLFQWMLNFKINIYTSQAFRKVVICWNRILERWNTSVWRLLKTVLKNELTVERLANSWTISYFWTKRWTIRIRSERLISGWLEIRIWVLKWDNYPFKRL